MQLVQLTGPKARGTPSVATATNSTTPLESSCTTRGRPQEISALRAPSPGGCVLATAGLQQGERCVGEVRLPLTLHTAPVAHLVVKPGARPPVWYVRLPNGEGVPCWRELSRTEPIRWAIASGLPHVARAALELLQRANDLRGVA